MGKGREEWEAGEMEGGKGVGGRGRWKGGRSVRGRGDGGRE